MPTGWIRKNRYWEDIHNGNRMSEDSVRKKLNTIEEEFSKVVLIVDDSVVRGNTSRRIGNGKGAGAKKVYFASCSPDRPSERVA